MIYNYIFILLFLFTSFNLMANSPAEQVGHIQNLILNDELNKANTELEFFINYAKANGYEDDVLDIYYSFKAILYSRQGKPKMALPFANKAINKLSSYPNYDPIKKLFYPTINKIFNSLDSIKKVQNFKDILSFNAFEFIVRSKHGTGYDNKPGRIKEKLVTSFNIDVEKSSKCQITLNIYNYKRWCGGMADLDCKYTSFSYNSGSPFSIGHPSALFERVEYSVDISKIKFIKLLSPSPEDTVYTHLLALSYSKNPASSGVKNINTNKYLYLNEESVNIDPHNKMMYWTHDYDYNFNINNYQQLKNYYNNRFLVDTMKNKKSKLILVSGKKSSLQKLKKAFNNQINICQ